MNPRIIRKTAMATLAAGMLTGLAACGEQEGDSAPQAGAIPVEATDNACKVTPPSAPVGKIAFQVTNKGAKTTEFYLYGPDGNMLSEVEDISPGTSRTMSLQVTQPGKYTTACKPGMTGSGIRGEFTVTGK